MNTRSKFGAWCAALSLAVSSAFAAPNILYIASANDATYQALITAEYPEAVWVQKPTGTGDDQIGGDLDAAVNMTIDSVLTPTTRKAYMESFDLIIVGVPVNSGNFVDGAGGGDWANLAKPVIFHSAFAARGDGGRTGMLAGVGVITPTLAAPDDSVRVSATAFSDLLFAGTTSTTDLYTALNTDTMATANAIGQGEAITTLSTTVPSSVRGIVYWPAGSLNGAGLTMLSNRAYLPLKIGNLSTDLTADGQIVLANIIEQLLIAPEEPIFPAPIASATSGVGQVNLQWSDVAGATSYNVKRSTVSGGPYTTIGANVAGLTYTDTAVINDTTYFYVVSAVGTVESDNSAEVNGTPVSVIQPAKNILYVSSGNSINYQTFATSGQFAANTWTHKVSGLTGNDLIGGDLDRIADFTGVVNAATGISVRTYLESFDLVILSVPNTSGNFIDDVLGADWASLNVPVIVHTVTIARSSGGRVGLFSGDNFIAATFGATDSTRVSTSPVSDALLAGVADVTNLYAADSIDTVNAFATYGRGELITSVTTADVIHHGVVFWATGAKTPNGFPVAANRAFIPVRGGIDDLNLNGRRVLANTINALDGTYAIPALPAPTNLVATAGEGTIELSWTAATGAVTYTISRSTTPGSGYEVISSGTVVGITYSDATAAAGTTYYYTVTSVDELETATSAEASVTLPGTGPTLTGWRLDNFGSEDNSGDGADQADPDADGLVNLIEYATGTDPNVADAGPAAALGQSAGKLTLTFNRIADPLLTYTVRGSNDLTAPWTETPVFTSAGTDNVDGELTVEDAVAIADQARRFLRLEVSY